MAKSSGKNSNFRVVAEPSWGRGYDILLDFSGSREWIASRENGDLYAMLRGGGMHIDDLRRWKPGGMAGSLSRRDITRLDRSVRNLLAIIDRHVDGRCRQLAA